MDLTTKRREYVSAEDAADALMTLSRSKSVDLEKYTTKGNISEQILIPHVGALYETPSCSTSNETEKRKPRTNFNITPLVPPNSPYNEISLQQKYYIYDSDDEVEHQSESLVPPIAKAYYNELLMRNKYKKIDFVRRLIVENPINTAYNPRKSRLRKEYATEKERFGRDKNNVASRNSRLKKKYASRLRIFKMEFYEEDSHLKYDRIQSLEESIAKLEEDLMKNNYDLLRIQCIREMCKPEMDEFLDEPTQQ